jgi:hypothetical protein
MDIKGKVHEVLSVTNVSETFKKRELIIEFAENPQYPEYIKFEALQDKVNLFDPLKVGDQVEVFFNLRGRPWTDKAGKTSYFNTLVVWRVNVISGTADASASSPAPANLSSSAEDDDLPF